MGEPDTGRNERGSCASGVRVCICVCLCVCVCERERGRVVEGVMRGQQASLPPLPEEGLLCDRLLVSCRGSSLGP